MPRLKTHIRVGRHIHRHANEIHPQPNGEDEVGHKGYCKFSDSWRSVQPHGLLKIFWNQLLNKSPPIGPIVRATISPTPLSPGCANVANSFAHSGHSGRGTSAVRFGLLSEHQFGGAPAHTAFSMSCSKLLPTGMLFAIRCFCMFTSKSFHDGPVTRKPVSGWRNLNPPGTTSFRLLRYRLIILPKRIRRCVHKRIAAR